jgi:glycine oxidase
VDNRSLTQAVLAAAKHAGAEIFARHGVHGIWQEGGRCAGLRLRDENVGAAWTVVAAGAFSSQIDGAQNYAPVRPAKGQILALRADGLKMERVLWSDRVYLVPRDDGRIVAGATVEYVGFEKGVTAGGVATILAAAIALAPGLADARIDETWAGLRPDSPDHLPILGPTDVDGLLMATGHFRSGVLLAPITARLVREWITLQRVSVDWERFSPLRFVEEQQSKTA